MTDAERLERAEMALDAVMLAWLRCVGPRAEIPDYSGVVQRYPGLGRELAARWELAKARDLHNSAVWGRCGPGGDPPPVPETPLAGEEGRQ